MTEKKKSTGKRLPPKLGKGDKRMVANKVYPSTRPGKKKMVFVVRGNKSKLIHFGDKNMKDFTQHGSEKRRKSFLARSGGIRNKSGQLTKNDPFSSNYWSRRVLWIYLCILLPSFSLIYG